MSRAFRWCALPFGLCLVAACARMGPPPGGPEDKLAPKLLGTVPESLGTYPGWKSDVEFQFDEVISEGTSPNMGTGTGDLEKLVIVSPTTKFPVVRWKRDRIVVHPKEGWQPDRVYRIQLLPGVLDLRRNRADTSVVLTFATGGELPTDTIRGLVIDWPAGKAARQALVELYLLPDSLIYRTVTDSTGRFEIGPLPRAGWTVYAVDDENRNHRLDAREMWDSTVIAAGVRDAPPLWMIPRDTIGPRITGITPDDSLKATIAFSLPLDPAQAVESLAVSMLRQKDSTPVGIVSLLPLPADDSLERASRAAADTGQRDTTLLMPKVPAPRPAQPAKGRPAPSAADSAARARAKAQVDSLLRTRPALYDKLVLRVAEPFEAEARYLVEVRGVRSVSGASADSKGVLAIPKPRAPADTTRTPADSTRPPPDSLAPPRDSAGPPPPRKP